MNLNALLLIFLTSLLGFLVLYPVANSSSQTIPDWHESVDPWVLDAAIAANEAEFIIFLSEQADLNEAKQLTNKVDKGTFVFEKLTAIAS
jgi:hypothetical protein